MKCNCWSVAKDIESYEKTPKDLPVLLNPLDYLPLDRDWETA